MPSDFKKRSQVARSPLFSKIMPLNHHVLPFRGLYWVFFFLSRKLETIALRCREYRPIWRPQIKGTEMFPEQHRGATVWCWLWNRDLRHRWVLTGRAHPGRESRTDLCKRPRRCREWHRGGMSHSVKKWFVEVKLQKQRMIKSYFWAWLHTCLGLCEGPKSKCRFVWRRIHDK